MCSLQPPARGLHDRAAGGRRVDRADRPPPISTPTRVAPRTTTPIAARGSWQPHASGRDAQAGRRRARVRESAPPVGRGVLAGRRQSGAPMSTGRGIVPDDVLDRVACASLVDAMGRIHGHRAHILCLVSPAPRRMFGPVATIAYLPTATTCRRPSSGSALCFIRPLASSRRARCWCSYAAVTRRLPRRWDEALPAPARRGGGGA